MKSGYGGLLFVVLMVAAVGGWVANIYKIITAGLSVAEWGGLEVARIVGIFVPPLGSILGFF